MSRINYIKKSVSNDISFKLPKNFLTLVIGSNEPDVFPKYDFKNIIFQHTSKEILIKAENLNIKTTTSANGKFDLVIITLPRSKEEALGNISKAYDLTKPGCLLVLEGFKTDGVETIIKLLQKHILFEKVVSKSHGKIAFLRVTVDKPEVFRKWMKFITPKRNTDGFVTTAGIFSKNRVDPASRFLADHFNQKIRGSVADLGAGWGYLSFMALHKSTWITDITLYEDNFNAIENAKINIDNKKAKFEWTDITTNIKLERKYDAVICNPPFHTGRKTDVNLGISFLIISSKMLKKSGRLWLVLNNHIPYEKELTRIFKNFYVLKETKSYKIVIAERPK